MSFPYNYNQSFTFPGKPISNRKENGMDNKKLINIFVLFILTIVVNVNVEGATKINEALDVVEKYQEFTHKGEWLEQSKLIIKDDIDSFKDRIISIPRFNALKEKSGNELYSTITSVMMNNVKIDKLEIIGSIQESDELVHVVTRSTLIIQNVKQSIVKLHTIKYLNNEWKISAAERLNNIVDRLHLKLLKSKMEKLRASMSELEKLKNQISKMRGSETQK